MRERATLQLVAGEQDPWRTTTEDRRELPGEVHRIDETRIGNAPPLVRFLNGARK
jgi:hypothetical protein